MLNKASQEIAHEVLIALRSHAQNHSNLMIIIQFRYLIIKQFEMQVELLFPRHDPMMFPATVRLSDFQFLKLLGEGSFGKVSRYMFKQTGANYAIKSMKMASSTRQDLVSMIRKELQVLYRVDCEHVVKLLDHFEEEGQAHLIMQFVDGRNIFEITNGCKNALPPKDVASILYQLCLGLEHLHSLGIIHRDLKLENIMLTNNKSIGSNNFSNGLLKIVDLGCSNYFTGPFPRKTILGTRPYYCPELFLHEKQDDRLDIWCVGVIVWECFWGQGPFPQPESDKKIKKCEYEFPQKKQIEPQLRDMFSRIFVEKNKRIRASELKEHQWVKKYCPEFFEKKILFEKLVSEATVQEYKTFLKQEIKQWKDYNCKINDRCKIFEERLRILKRQIKQ